MKNKVVLITGATGGVGREIAKTFACNGYNVAFCYNNSLTKAQNLKIDLESLGASCIYQKCDVSNILDVKSLVLETISTFGHIDVLVNCAGVCSYNLLIDEDTTNINNIINTNLIGTIYMCKEVCKHLIKQGFGKIINISSVWGLCGASNETVYSASKGAINTFTKALAKELAFARINVNAISPGVVNTNMLSKFSNIELEEIKKDIPFGRFAESKEISDLCLYLASENSSYITGQIITIDGGFTV